jgi:hypothetical protein
VNAPPAQSLTSCQKSGRSGWTPGRAKHSTGRRYRASRYSSRGRQSRGLRVAVPLAKQQHHHIGVADALQARLLGGRGERREVLSTDWHMA